MDLQLDYSKPDWFNLDVLQKNRMSPRAIVYSRGQHAGEARFLSLNGEWRFKFAENPHELPDGLAGEGVDDSGWDTLAVPSEWELHGYGRPHCTGSLAPFPVDCDDPYPPEYNPTGFYRRRFTLPEDDLRTVLRFDGVESGFHLWVNGVPAGYSQGSRLPAEFDITPHLRPGENLLAVRVYKFTSGSYLECRNTWWLAGIFRDVSLIRRPACHLADVRATGLLEPEGSGRLEVTADCAGLSLGDTLRLSLSLGGSVVYSAEAPAAPSVPFAAEIPDVMDWNAETPALYHLAVALCAAGGEVRDIADVRVGFRRYEVANGLFYVNGSALRIRGVNYNLWRGAHGRASDPAQVRADLEYLKANNVNAVRCAPYPQMAGFYDICDELGLYVMDECDIHTGMTALYGKPDQLAQNPKWKSAFLERARRMVGQNRNHPCVFLWSLGSASGWGPNFAAAASLIRELDPTRPIHCEGDREARSADVYGSAYTAADTLAQWGEKALPKPHIVCEYAGAAGNGPGNLEEYWDVFHQYPRMQGGFVWTYRDQTLNDRHGGDYAGAPDEDTACAGGLTLADGIPTPAMAQVRHALAPVRAQEYDAENRRVLLWNRYDFTPLSALEVECAATADGATLAAAKAPLPPVPPGQKAWVVLPPALFEGDPELLDLKFYKGGQWVDTCQFRLREHRHPVAAAVPGTVSAQRQGDEIILKAGEVELAVSALHGVPVRYSVGGRPLLCGRTEFCFARAPIAGDSSSTDPMQPALMELEVKEGESSAIVTAHKRYAPCTRNWRIEVTLRCTLFADGTFALDAEGHPVGEPPQSLGRLGLYATLPGHLDQVRWHGRGPEECYRDSKLGTPVGLYEANVDGLHFPYAVPQENGNRTDVDYVIFHDGQGGLRVDAQAGTGLNFAAHRYTLNDLAAANHNGELPHREEVFVHLDHAHHGLGSAGPGVLPQHTLAPEDFRFSWVLRPWAFSI